MALKAPGFRIGSSYSVAFSPDGDHLAVVGRSVAIWSVSLRKRLRSVGLLRHPAAVAFSPDGRTFVVKNTSGELLVAETDTADPVARFVPRGQDEGANPMYSSPDRIIDGSWSGEIRERDATRLEPRTLWRDERCTVGRVLYAAGLWAFKVTATHNHPEFHTDSGGDQILVSPAPGSAPLTPLSRSWRSLRAAALSPDGKRLAVRHGTTQRVVEIVDVATGRVLAAGASEFGGTGHALAWAPEGKTLVLVEQGGFSFRDASDLREVGWIPSRYPAHPCFAPNGALLALGDWSKGFVVPWPGLISNVKPGRSAASSTSVA